MEKRRYTRLTPEQRQEVADMYRNKVGSQREIAAMYNISQKTVSYICAKEGIDVYHKGGWNARKLPRPTFTAEPPKPTIANQKEVCCVVQKRSVTLTGLGTNYQYTVTTKATQVVLSNATGAVSIDLDKIDDLILELQAVRDNASSIKVGCEAW